MIAVRLHVEWPDENRLPRPARLTVLRGQLTLIRTQAENGFPVSVESIGRAEELARSLELDEVTL